MNKKRNLTAEDLFNIEVYSDPQTSPTGEGYVFVSTTINEEKEYDAHLFFQNFVTKEVNQWTFGNVKNSYPRFSPCGKYLAFQSDRTGVPQIWVLRTDGGEATQITTFKNGAETPHWSKDGKYIIFTAMLAKNDCVKNQQELTVAESITERDEASKRPIIINELKHKKDAVGFFDDKRRQLVQYDIEAKTFKQLTKEFSDHYFEDISPDGNQILFSANFDDALGEETLHLYSLDIKANSVTKLTKGMGTCYHARFSPSGKKIVSFGHEFAYYESTINELYVFDIETGKRTCISESWDMQLDDYTIGDTRLGQSTTGPVWSKDEKKIFFIATHFGSTALYSVDLQGNLEILNKNDHHLFGFSYNEIDGSFIVGISTPTMPNNFYKLTSNKLEQLTEANKFLEKVALSEPETISVKSEDGFDIQGWLLRPYEFNEQNKYPFILEIHGGPHAMYGYTFFHEMQLLAAKGYAVLYTNPRGSHGYGQQFAHGTYGDYGGGDYRDLMLSVDYVLERYDFIDKNRLGVTGGSYGGFMTNWIVGHTNRFKVAVTQRSISNWLSMFGTSDIGYFFCKWELGVDLLDSPEKLWDFSPLKYTKNIETPLLILHSEKDLNVSIEQSEQLFTTLKFLGKEVEFIRFPNENHELSRSGNPQARLERLHHICRWFEKYL